jgi:hypothetical protein
MKTPLEGADGSRPAARLDEELRPTDGRAGRGSDLASEWDGFFDWLRNPHSDASADPSALAFVLFLIIGLVALALTTIGPDAYVPPDGHSGPSLSPHEKRLASKAAYRVRRSADPVFRESESQRVREWRRDNPDKTRDQKSKARTANYNRPFVVIDSEGQDYLDDDVLHDGVRHPMHDTYLWGAASDDGRSPLWLTAPETRGVDKRPLSPVEILDWLLDLPRRYDGKAVFVMFSFKYDITQIIKHFDYFTAWEIFNTKHTATTTASSGKSAIRRYFGKITRLIISMENTSISKGWRTLKNLPRPQVRNIPSASGFTTFLVSSSRHSVRSSTVWSRAAEQPATRLLLSET